MRPRAAVDQMEVATPHGRGLVLLVVVVAVAAVDVVVAAAVVVVVLEAAVPAVEGSGQRGAFYLNVHPVAAGTGRVMHVITI